MKRKVLATLAVATALAVSAVPVFADEQSVTGTGTTQAVVPSSFVAENDTTSVIVSLPTNLDLSFNEDTNKYSKSATLSAKGDMSSKKMLTITIEDITYELQGYSTIHAEATHHFGADASVKSTAYSSEQLKNSKTTEDSRGFDIDVEKASILKNGHYQTTVMFDIDVSNK